MSRCPGGTRWRGFLNRPYVLACTVIMGYRATQRHLTGWRMGVISGIVHIFSGNNNQMERMAKKYPLMILCISCGSYNSTDA